MRNSIFSEERISAIKSAMTLVPVPVPVPGPSSSSADASSPKMTSRYAVASVSNTSSNLVQPDVPTLVFVNLAAHASLLSNILNKKENIHCLPYHKDMRAVDKANALQAFRDGEVTLLISTDASARYVAYFTCYSASE